MLQPGLQDNAAIYREKTYYCSSPEARKTFLENPKNYVVHKEPLQVLIFVHEDQALIVFLNTFENLVNVSLWAQLKVTACSKQVT